jgi:hypothetical protein
MNGGSSVEGMMLSQEQFSNDCSDDFLAIALMTMGGGGREGGVSGVGGDSNNHDSGYGNDSPESLGLWSHNHNGSRSSLIDNNGFSGSCGNNDNDNYMKDSGRDIVGIQPNWQGGQKAHHHLYNLSQQHANSNEYLHQHQQQPIMQSNANVSPGGAVTASVCGGGGGRSGGAGVVPQSPNGYYQMTPQSVGSMVSMRSPQQQQQGHLHQSHVLQQQQQQQILCSSNSQLCGQQQQQQLQNNGLQYGSVRSPNSNLLNT